MFSSRRSALCLALAISASFGSASSLLQAQASNSETIAEASSQSSAPAAAQEPAPAAPAPQAAPQPHGPLTVQARIKARREQRRAAAIKDVYTHLYEVYVGAGYLRFHPGDDLQRINQYSWDLGVTRYFNERLGVTVDGRGLYGYAYIGPNAASNTAIFKPGISEYLAMGGPTYRFYMQPKYSISGRVMGGYAYGYFSSNTHPFNTTTLGLYPDGSGVAINASVPVEYNVSGNLGLRIAPDYTFTNFGSSTQNGLGFTGGVVVRWGKQ
jgi:hypothetical protein